MSRGKVPRRITHAAKDFVAEAKKVVRTLDIEEALASSQPKAVIAIAEGTDAISHKIDEPLLLFPTAKTQACLSACE